MSIEFMDSKSAQKQLKSIVERVERLSAQRDDLGADITEIFKEAKDNGFDPKIIRHIIKQRKQTKDEREAFEQLVETYMKALGMLSDTPLGKAAISREGLAA